MQSYIVKIEDFQQILTAFLRPIKKAVSLHPKNNLFSQYEIILIQIRESCFMVMYFCLSMHSMYENLKVGPMSTSSCIFFQFVANFFFAAAFLSSSVHPVFQESTDNCLRGRPLIMWGGGVQNKKIVSEGRRKKKSSKGHQKKNKTKNIMFRQFNPKFFFNVFSVKLCLIYCDVPGSPCLSKNGSIAYSGLISSCFS